MKLVPKTGHVLERVLARFARIWRRAFRAMWPKGIKFVGAPSKRFRTSLIALLIIGAAATGGTLLFRMTGDDVDQEGWSISQITRVAQSRLKAIADALDSTRDWLVADQSIESAIASNNPSKLFSTLAQRDQSYISRLPDSAIFTTLSGARRTANRGFAAYSADGRLMAWYSPVAVTFGFDTVLTGAMRLPSRDRGVMLENGPLYAYLVAVRKIVSIDGQVEAFIVAKQQLATKEPLSSSPTSSYIDDIKPLIGRNLAILFGGTPAAPHSVADSVVYLFADPSDPTSFVGSMAIGREAQERPSVQFEILHDLASFAFSIAVFCIAYLAANCNCRCTSDQKADRSAGNLFGYDICRAWRIPNYHY